MAKNMLPAMQQPLAPSDIRFDELEFDITDVGCQLCLCVTCPLHFLPLIPGVMGRKVLTLEAEEAVVKTSCVLCDSKTRRPYGELGSVDTSRVLCCNGVKANVFDIGGQAVAICPGWGCQRALVDEVAEVMKVRMKSRGDTGQIVMAERNYQELVALREEVRALRADVMSLTMQR